MYDPDGMLSSTHTVPPLGDGEEAVAGVQPTPSVPMVSNHTRPPEIWNFSVSTSWPRRLSGVFSGISKRVQVPVDGSAPRLNWMMPGSAPMVFEPQYTDTWRYADL